METQRLAIIFKVKQGGLQKAISATLFLLAGLILSLFQMELSRHIRILFTTSLEIVENFSMETKSNYSSMAKEKGKSLKY